MENGDLRSHSKRIVTWRQKLNNIYDVCLALNNIHIHKLIHKDLHPGNVFIDSSFAYIGDFGFCMPASEIVSYSKDSSSKKKIYGVMPYMAPEILRGESYTLASDIYSLGVIINEIIAVIPSFNDQPHDLFLALDICRGLRPTIRVETPDLLKKLIEKCWDANPENRPTSEEIFNTLSQNLCEYKQTLPRYLSSNVNEESSTNITSSEPEIQYELKIDSLSSMRIKSHHQAIYTSRLLNLQNLPKPVNCPNQQQFVSSGNIMEIQTGEFLLLIYFKLVN